MHWGGQRAWKFCYVRTAVPQPERLEKHPGCADGGGAVASGLRDRCPCWTSALLCWFSGLTRTPWHRRAQTGTWVSRGRADMGSPLLYMRPLCLGACGNGLWYGLVPSGSARCYWGRSALAGRGARGDEQSVLSQIIELVTADKFAGKLSLSLPRN